MHEAVRLVQGAGSDVSRARGELHAGRAALAGELEGALEERAAVTAAPGLRDDEEVLEVAVEVRAKTAASSAAATRTVIAENSLRRSPASRSPLCLPRRALRYKANRRSTERIVTKP